MSQNDRRVIEGAAKPKPSCIPVEMVDAVVVSGEPAHAPSASSGHPPVGNDLALNVRGGREGRWRFWLAEATPRVEGDETFPGQSLLDPHRGVKVDFGTSIKDALGRDANLEV